jgi:hypothetical protein
MANWPVLLSLLFVLQFVPVEHIPCLFGHAPVHMMKCHSGTDEGVQVVPAHETGWATCCVETTPESFVLPTREIERPAIVRNLAPYDSPPVVPTVGGLDLTYRHRGDSPGTYAIDRPIVFAALLI